MLGWLLRPVMKVSNVLSRVREALTRKFGPLPAWAWAILAAAGIFIWRSRTGQYAAVTAAEGDGEVPEAREPREPVSLSPGESVYDPETGNLVGTAPEQEPSDAEPQRPTVLKPGQSAVTADGRLVTAPILKPPKKRRKPKPKPQHGRGKKKPGPRGHGKNKPRGHGKIRKPAPRKKHKPPHPRNQPGGKKRPLARTAQIIRPSRTRGAAPKWGAMRQRPAATHPAPSTDARAHPKASPHAKPAKPRVARRPIKRKRR